MSDGLFATALLGGCFCFGILTGFLVCFCVPVHGVLGDRLLLCFQRIAKGSRVPAGFLTIVWDSVKWPLFATILGMTQSAVVAIPILVAVRGFLLVHAITVFSQLFGFDGWLMAAALFGMTALIGIPAFFIVCFDRFHAALLRRAGKKCGGIYFRGRFFVPIIALTGSSAAIAAQYVLIPALVSFVCKKFFT